MFSSEKNISDVMSHFVKQQSAPDIDFVVFNGNPLDSHYFMTHFHEAVEKRIDDLRGRLTRLLKCTSGDGKRNDQKLCTGTTNYGLSTYEEDTLRNTETCHGRIYKRGLNNHKK